MSKILRPSIMYVFPGQGSQYLGMGSDIFHEFACARVVYERAADCMGFDVARLSFEGPEAQLNGTENTQIALLTHTIACLAVFRQLTDDRWTATAMAGHSLGEYSALVAAGALAFEDALRLIRMRGRLMSRYGRGQMAAFRLDLESIKPFADARYCGIGGCNLPDQTVVCGFENDLEALMDDVMRHYGRAKAGRYLKTEGAFHTYLMIGAAERFRPHLDATPVKTPAVKVLSNYTGDYHDDDPERIRAALFFQMFHPVRWMLGLQRAIDDGVNLVIEFGGGIGREQPGVAQSPATRKPNLESITRKAYSGAGRGGLYLPAINLASLRQAARVMELLQQAATVAQVDDGTDAIWLDERRFSLYLPVRDGIVGEAAVELSILVQELGLTTVVRTIAEAEDDSLDMLQCSGDRGVAAAEPYLEVIVGGGTGAFLHYRGDTIRRELGALRDRLERRGCRTMATGRSGVVESG